MGSPKYFNCGVCGATNKKTQNMRGSELISHLTKFHKLSKYQIKKYFLNYEMDIEGEPICHNIDCHSGKTDWYQFLEELLFFQVAA